VRGRNHHHLSTIGDPHDHLIGVLSDFHRRAPDFKDPLIFIGASETPNFLWRSSDFLWRPRNFYWTSQDFNRRPQDFPRRLQTFHRESHIFIGDPKQPPIFIFSLTKIWGRSSKKICGLKRKVWGFKWKDWGLQWKCLQWKAWVSNENLGS